MRHDESRLLLLTASPPGTRGVGQLYVRSIVDHVPTGTTVRLAELRGRHSPPHAGYPDAHPMSGRDFPTRFEPSFRVGSGAIGSIAAGAATYMCLYPYVSRLSRNIAEFARLQGATRVLAILESPSAMLLAAPVARRLGVPLHTLVWDVPEQVLPRWGHLGWSARILKRGFERAIRASASVGVLSEAMAGYIEAIAQKPIHLLRQPMEPHWGEGATFTGSESTVYLGFAGSVTAAAEIEAVMRALDSVCWKLNGRRVVLRVFSNRFVCTADCERHVEYLGYAADTPDVVRGLAACDILLLPQPFSARDEPFVRYSFPTKFTTYLAARRPILLIAPEVSALAGYFRDNGLSAVFSDMVPAGIVRHLESLLETECVVTCTGRYEVVADRDFSVSGFKKSLESFLGTSHLQDAVHAQAH